MPGLSDLFRGQPRLTRRWRHPIGDHVISLAWSPKGDLLAAVSVSGPITLLDAAGQPRATLAGHGFGTAMVAWQPGGALLASGGQDGKVKVWDATALGPEALQQRQARSVVEFLFARGLSRSDVLARIRADAGLTEPVRRRALVQARTRQAR